jgi:hypothetical protein
MLSKDNWISMSWGGVIPRTGPEDLEVVFHSKAAAVPSSFEAAATATAKDIASKYDNLYLGISGGADSESVADALYNNNIPFTPIIIEWDGLGTLSVDQSNMENQYAYFWCKRRNITPYILKLNKSIFADGSYANVLETSRPRLQYAATMLYVSREVERLGGNLLTGNQLEFCPDEQFTRLDGIPENYRGFILSECDFYLETDKQDRHPWGFYYWSPEMMAATVKYWPTDVPMTEAKAALYGTPYRPKIFNNEFIRNIPTYMWTRKRYGTIDGALLGDKEELLAKLIS